MFSILNKTIQLFASSIIPSFFYNEMKWKIGLILLFCFVFAHIVAGYFIKPQLLPPSIFAFFSLFVNVFQHLPRNIIIFYMS